MADIEEYGRKMATIVDISDELGEFSSRQVKLILMLRNKYNKKLFIHFMGSDMPSMRYKDLTEVLVQSAMKPSRKQKLVIPLKRVL